MNLHRSLAQACSVCRACGGESGGPALTPCPLQVLALHGLVAQRQRASLGDLEQHGMLTQCCAETAFQCQKSWNGIFLFFGSRAAMTVAELPRLCYLGIDLACRHAQQHVDMLGSLL